MLESAVEAYLCKRVKAMGGRADKFTSPNRRSVPDRLIMLPGVEMFFIECKALGKKPTAAQAEDHAYRLALGKRVFVVDSKEAVDAVLAKFEGYL